MAFIPTQPEAHGVGDWYDYMKNKDYLVSFVDAECEDYLFFTLNKW